MSTEERRGRTRERTNVGNHRPGRDHGGLDKDGKATGVGFGALSMPGGDGRGFEAGTESGDDTADDELSAGPVSAESGDLDQDAEQEDECTDIHHAVNAILSV